MSAAFDMNRRLRLGEKRNTVQKAAEQREQPGECPWKHSLTGRLAPVPLLESQFVERCWR